MLYLCVVARWLLCTVGSSPMFNIFIICFSCAKSSGVSLGNKKFRLVVEEIGNGALEIVVMASSTSSSKLLSRLPPSPIWLYRFFEVTSLLGCRMLGSISWSLSSTGAGCCSSTSGLDSGEAVRKRFLLKNLLDPGWVTGVTGVVMRFGERRPGLRLNRELARVVVSGKCEQKDEASI